VQRPGRERVHDALRSADVLAVCRLDRLGRSLKHLIKLMAELVAERIRFQSVTESIDTTRWPSSYGQPLRANAQANLLGPLQRLHAARNRNAAPVKFSDWLAASLGD